jgi:hypothetical protein
VDLYFTGVDVFLCPASSRRTGRMSAVFPTLFYTFRKLRERFRGVAMAVSAGAGFHS